MKKTATPSVPTKKGRVLVVFDSFDGQTRKIAEYVCSLARGKGCTTILRHLSEQASTITVEMERKEVESASAVVVLGPIRNRTLPPSLFRFVRQHGDEISQRPSALFYVSLGAAAKQRLVRQAVEKVAQGFLTRTSWRPEIRASIGGALAYPKYSRAMRFTMQLAARIFGLPTNTSHIQELTNWSIVERETTELLHLIARPTAGAATVGGIAL